MRSSLIVLTFTLAAACGRDPLIGVPGPGTGTGGSAGSVGAIPQAGTGGGAIGGTGGNTGVAGGAGTPDARPPVIPIRDAAPAPPPDAAPGACANLPACLTALNTACPTVAPCVQRMAMGTTIQCYPNNQGVKLAIAVAGQTTTVTVVRANGMPCYTLTAARGGMGGGQMAPIQLTYDNGATGTIQPNTTMVAAACGMGARQNYQLSCLPGGAALLGLAGVGGMSACTTVNAMMCAAP